MFAEKSVALSGGPELIVDHASTKLPKADPIKPSQLDFNGLGSIKVGNQKMKATVPTPHSKQPGPVFPSARWFAQGDQQQKPRQLKPKTPPAKDGKSSKWYSYVGRDEFGFGQQRYSPPLCSPLVSVSSRNSQKGSWGIIPEPHASEYDKVKGTCWAPGHWVCKCT